MRATSLRTRECSDALWQALLSREPIDPLTTKFADLSVVESYEIQSRFVQHRIDHGSRGRVGRKIGVTSKVVQDALNVRQPDFGTLLSEMMFLDGAEIWADSFISPRAEGEVAFVLGCDLRGPGLTEIDVLIATETLLPCIEIVDSRIKNWQIKIQDTIADNASSGAFVLGKEGVKVDDVDLSLVGMKLSKNGRIATMGAGAAALGSPAASVAWLANKLSEFSEELKAGDIVLSGSLGQLVPVNIGDEFNVSLNGIGSASFRLR
jgi:2-oxopent-4-enoate/cis-2-oxohex-4-enoate hydratase